MSILPIKTVVHDIDTKPQSVTSPRSSNVTIIGAGNAIPPYYIFPKKKFDRSLLLDGTPAGFDFEHQLSLP
jgi:hypothetical protein